MTTLQIFIIAIWLCILLGLFSFVIVSSFGYRMLLETIATMMFYVGVIVSVIIFAHEWITK
ncbi:hypothetical protein [Undibacterium sp. 10I3]|uniref:hypothetical protein n=1 Tax=Undibacterium sp. 10I3 TaxID=3048579 RepID=UPI002B23EAED|nr:hypothetical protein [Undibacterium sp. 10I3]MEB0231934.1 hypothetical protein [Undibacterium sp. 10I3]MEB0256285.1 hypothetical protein [Undibacterium sp. 5I1]